MVKSVNPYLNFDGTTEEAFELYRSVFGGELLGLVRFREFGGDEMQVPEDELDRIAHVALALGEGSMLMGTDVTGSASLTVGNNSYIHVELESGDEAARVFDGLADGGSVEMPLQATAWAERYGVCRDRFGVQWMVSYTGAVEFDPGP
jgi:PhnB protein